MRIVVTGATGNVGTALLRRLATERAVDEIVGVARRRPRAGTAKVRWVQADVAASPLDPIVRGADAVVHLAWAIQPSRDSEMLEAVNVRGSRRVFEATAAAGVPALVYASSVGAYSSGPKDRPVGEEWPTDGIDTSFYARHKAAAERALDAVERAHPGLRAVRLRPALIFQRDAASEIRRLFAGPFLPSPLVRPDLVPFVPATPRLAFQAVHAADVAEAYRLAIVSGEARGAYNVAADPVLDSAELARILRARTVRVPARVLRAVAALTWKLRLQPTPPGWVDMALSVPILDATRIRTELGWRPAMGADDALRELLDGMRDRAGAGTPPLEPAAGGPLRIRELLTGVGGRP
jgi:nucleoside-diphosphate-sugar epimerase